MPLSEEANKPMPLVFNSITQYHEQIGRRRTHKSDPSQLDSLDCIFIGPAHSADTVCPSDLARHPEFPGMQCTGWEVINKEAYTAEVRASYSGKLIGAGSIAFTDAKMSTSWHEGSISWTTLTGNYQVDQNGGQPFGVVEYRANMKTFYVSTSFSCRFTTRAVTYVYLTNQKPAGGFLQRYAADSANYLGIENQQTFRTGSSSSDSDIGLVTAWLVFESKMVDCQIVDQKNGWFQVTEVYTTQAYINSRA